MTPLVVLTPGVAGQFAIAGRRWLASLEANPNLDVGWRREVENVKAMIAHFDEVAKSGQLVHVLADVCDNESNLRGEMPVGAVAAAVSASPRTIRRYRLDGLLEGRRGTIYVSSLRKWLADGRPTRRVS